ncbi:MAG: T9SS type A sorting domain-containing protein [Bacteroidota bacterium]
MKMYKIFVGICALYMPIMVWAQNTTTLHQLQQSIAWIENQPAQVIQLQVQNESNKSITDLNTYIPYLSSEDLNLVHERNGKTGKYTQYVQLHKGLPIWGTSVRIHELKNGQLRIQHVTLNTSSSNSDVLNERATHWLLTGNKLEQIRVETTGGIQTISTAIGELIFQRDLRRYLHQDDTMVTGKVFAPDPLTRAGVIYGQDGTWKHFNDSDYALLNDQRIDVTFPATLVGDSFELRNAYGRIVDFSQPFTSNRREKNPVFNYTRKQQAFKDVMALYHVYHTQMYLQSLQYDVVQYPIRIDAGASFGDQSFFTFDPDTSLNFGLGGVPDAEDADVIVHEYTHAVSWDINPTPNMSTERRAIEEAMCDVLAAVQSKQYTPFNWRRLFNFDAPNPVAPGNIPFWNGRNGQSAKTYDEKLNDPYRDSEIWTSCMLDMSEYFGSDTLVDMMLASIELMTSTTTMPEACELMLIADSLLYNGENRLMMGYFFNERRFGNFPMSVRNTTAPKNYRLLNTAAFAIGQGPINIEMTNAAAFDVVLTDMTGKTRLHLRQHFLSAEIKPDELPAGIYILTITQNGQSRSEKIVRY